MGDGQLVKIRAATAAEICAQLDLNTEAWQLMCAGMVPREFVDAHMANKQYLAGIEFVAHALPAREAIWWGCLCLQHACGDALSAPDWAACRAAVQWVLWPTDENRAAAKAPAEAAGLGSPAGALAAAASQTGGNTAPPQAPPMAPGPFAPGKAVAMAVKLAATKGNPIRIIDRQRCYFELGVGMAEGRYT